MHLAQTLLILATFASPLLAAGGCIQASLLGLPIPSVTSLPDTYIIYARDGNGNYLPIVQPQNPGSDGFYFPLSLGAHNASLDAPTTPKINLIRGLAYSGGETLATKQPLNLGPTQLYFGADSSQSNVAASAVNGTCEDGENVLLLRFNNILDLPLEGGSINGTFETGAGLQSPSVTGLLGLHGIGVDLVLREYDD